MQQTLDHRFREDPPGDDLYGRYEAGAATGAIAITVGAGALPTVFGVPAGVVAIVYGAIKEIKAIALSVPTAITGYARWKRRDLSEHEQTIIKVCKRIKTVLGGVTSALHLDISKWVSILVTAIEKILGWLGWLAQRTSEFQWLPESARRVLSWIGGVLQSLSAATSHIHAFLSVERWDEALAEIVVAVQTLISWFRDIYHAYKGEKAPPMVDFYPQSQAVSSPQSGIHPPPIRENAPGGPCWLLRPTVLIWALDPVD